MLDKIQTGNFKTGTFGAEFQTWLKQTTVDVLSLVIQARTEQTRYVFKKTIIA